VLAIADPGAPAPPASSPPGARWHAVPSGAPATFRF
jgi:hypothetical protein